jgi:hypothetical protein
MAKNMTLSACTIARTSHRDSYERIEGLREASRQVRHRLATYAARRLPDHRDDLLGLHPGSPGMRSA